MVNDQAAVAPIPAAQLHVLRTAIEVTTNMPSHSALHGKGREKICYLCQRGCWQHSAVLVEIGVTRDAAADADATRRCFLVTECLHVMQHATDGKCSPGAPDHPSNPSYRPSTSIDKRHAACRVVANGGAHIGLESAQHKQV
jgi:hypothetical protein